MPHVGEDALVRSLTPVARGLASAYVRRCRRRRHDDAYADALSGLLEAVRTYDPARGVPLRAYAAYLARKRIIDGARADSPLTREQRRDGLREPAAFSAVFRGRHGGAPPAAPQASADAAEAVAEIMRRVPERHRRVATAHLLGGLTQAAVARNEGVGPAMISLIMAEFWREARAAASWVLCEPVPDPGEPPPPPACGGCGGPCRPRHALAAPLCQTCAKKARRRRARQR